MALADKIPTFNSAVDIVHQVAHGDSSTVVQTDSGPVRSIAKLIADNQEKITGLTGLEAALAGPNGSDKVAVRDKIATSYLKTLSDIANGDPVSLLRFIKPTEHAAIRARTTTYDATADLTTALTATNNAATPHLGLVMPAGLILCAGSINAGRNITLRAQGWRSTIRLANGANAPYIIKFGDESAQTTMELHDIEFDANKGGNPTGGDGIIIVRGYKANMFNARAVNCRGDGFQYEANGSAFENYLYGISSYNNNGVGVRMVGAGITDTHIIGGDIGYNGIAGVVLATSCSINGSTVWGGGLPNSKGIITAGSSSQIISTRTEGHGQHGIHVTAGSHYIHIDGGKLYANSFNAATTGQYDGIYIEAGADYGTISGLKGYSSLSNVDAFLMRYAINFAGAHKEWKINGTDLSCLGLAGAPSGGRVVNGILETDRFDGSWIRTSVKARRSADVLATVADDWTTFPYDQEDSDVLSEFVGGTFTPKNSGRYRIEAAFTCKPTAAGENLGLALYTNTGAVVRRIDFFRAEGTNSEMVKGSIDEFLTAGTAYDLRYLVGHTSTKFLAGPEFTYARIRAVPN